MQLDLGLSTTTSGAQSLTPAMEVMTVAIIITTAFRRIFIPPFYTAGSRNSGEYFVVVFMTPASQELESPGITGRFKQARWCR